MATATVPRATRSGTGAGWRNAAAYLRDPLGYMDALDDGSGWTHVPFPGGHSFLFLTDPEAIRRVLVDHGSSFVKGRALRAARRLLGEGLLTSEGADHLRRRRMIQPVFHRSLVEAYGEAMVQAADRTSARWQDGGTVDVNRAMADLALDIVGRTIFDADVEAEAPEIRRVLDAGMRVFHRFLLPGGELLWHLPLPSTRRFFAARAQFDAMVLDLIRARRGARAAGRPDLIDHLMALQDDQGGDPLTEREIRDEAVTLLLAGHETTAQALTWTWHLLSRHPQAGERVRAELDGVLGTRPVTAADASSLPYTGAVFREALRLYPPVWALARIAVRDVDLGIVRVPEGGTVIASQWVVHRSPRHWRDAASFRPERWLDDPPPDPGTYFPFGGGTRLCIGERFALLEGVLVVATLARRWHVETPNREPRLDARFTLRPHGGMPATVCARA